MRTNEGFANKSVYFAWEDFCTGEVSHRQVREYYICRETLDVWTPDKALPFRDRRHYIKTVESPPLSMFSIGDSASFTERLYELRRFVCPADWFPGICDAWVKANAGDANARIAA